MAEWFGKRHDNVLQSINKILADGDEDDALNFQAVTYIDAKGETRRAFEMTQTGFVLLAFGFTGKEALKFKKAYIAKFNAMETELRAIHEEQARINAEKLAQIEKRQSVMTVLEYMVHRKEKWPNVSAGVLRVSERRFRAANCIVAAAKWLVHSSKWVSCAAA